MSKEHLLLQIDCNLSELGESGFEVFDNFLRDDAGSRETGAVFEAFVFEPEPSRWEASETDGKARG